MRAIARILLPGLCCLAVASARAEAGKSQAPVTTLHPRITSDAARNIAQAKVPTGQITAHALELEKGHLVYSFDFVVANKTGTDKVNVDAITGAVRSVRHKSPETLKKEADKAKNEAVQGR